MKFAGNSPRNFVGSAVVKEASYDEQATTLTLRTFAGEHILYTLSQLPDSVGAGDFRSAHARPIAVKIQQGGGYCTATVLTAVGLQGLQISLGTALEFHRCGIHTVVDGGLKAAMACSAAKTTALAPQAGGISTCY